MHLNPTCIHVVKDKAGTTCCVARELEWSLGRLRILPFILCWMRMSLYILYSTPVLNCQESPILHYLTKIQGEGTMKYTENPAFKNLMSGLEYNLAFVIIVCYVNNIYIEHFSSQNQSLSVLENVLWHLLYSFICMNWFFAAYIETVNTLFKISVIQKIRRKWFIFKITSWTLLQWYYLSCKMSVSKISAGSVCHLSHDICCSLEMEESSH